MPLVNFDRLSMTFDLGYFLSEHATTEAKIELAEALAIEGDVIDAVVDLLCDGSTEGGNWIGHSADDRIENARVRLIEKLDPLKRELVADLLRDRNFAIAWKEEANEHRYALRKWAEDWTCPDCGKRRFAPEAKRVEAETVTDAAIAAALDGRVKA